MAGYAAYFLKQAVTHCPRAYLCVISDVIMLQPYWGVHSLKALISQALEPATSRQALLLHALLSSHSWGDKGTCRCPCPAAERLSEGGQGNRTGLLVSWCDVCQGRTSKRYTASLLVLRQNLYANNKKPQQWFSGHGELGICGFCVAALCCVLYVLERMHLFTVRHHSAFL